MRKARENKGKRLRNAGGSAVEREGEWHWEGQGKTMERNGKVKGKTREKAGGRADKAQKERQGPDPARKSLRSGSLVLPPLGGVSEKREERQGEQLEKRQGPDPARKSLRSWDHYGITLEPLWDHFGTTLGI